MTSLKKINKYQNPWSSLPMNDSQFGGFREGLDGKLYFLTPEELKEYDSISKEEREEVKNSNIYRNIQDQEIAKKSKEKTINKAIKEEQDKIKKAADDKSTRMFQAMNSGEFSDFSYDDNIKILNKINEENKVPYTYFIPKTDAENLFNSSYATSTAVNGANSFGNSLMALGLPAMTRGIINPIINWGTKKILTNTAIPTIATIAGGAMGAVPAQFVGNYIGGKLFGEAGSAWGGQLGTILGGTAGGALTSKIAPVKLGFMKSKAYDTFGAAETNVLDNNKLQWKYSIKSKYTPEGKIATKLFPKDEELAHEFGHWMGDNLSREGFTKGIYAPEYIYSDTSDPILNTIEHYADRFKTQLGYQYKGNNPQLIARQNVVNKYLNKEPLLLDVPRPNEDLNYLTKYNPEKELKWFDGKPHQLNDNTWAPSNVEINIETVPPHLIPKEALVYKRKIPYIRVNRNGKEELIPLPKESVTGDLVERENGFDRMIHGENADKLANEIKSFIWNWKRSPEYLIQAANELMPSGANLDMAIKSLADTSPELYSSYIANDPKAVQIINALWKIKNGQFRIPEIDINGNLGILGGPVKNGELILPNIVEDSYPLSLIPYIKAAIANPSTSSNIANIIGGVKGVIPTEGINTFEEKVAAQRPKNYTPEEIWTGQYVTDNMPVAMFYSKHGTSRAGKITSAYDYFNELIDSQMNWTDDAKIEAKKLVKFIEDGLKNMNGGKKGRHNSLWTREETKNPVFLKTTIPEDFSFPGDLSTGTLIKSKIDNRMAIETAINKLSSMLGNKNMGGVLELFAAYPKDGVPTINYNGDWWRHIDLDGYPKSYGLYGNGSIPYSWKYLNGSNPTFKNIDEFSHSINSNQVGKIVNIIDAINGPIGTDWQLGLNLYGLKKGGILKRIK